MNAAACSSVALAAIAMTPVSVHAEDVWQAASADFAKVCVAALLAPDKLPEALSERDMTEYKSEFAPPGFDGVMYGAGSGGRGVTVAYDRYSDFKSTSCVAAASKSASSDDLDALRIMLESDERIGKLEGRILQAAPSVKIARFKRPGNAPVLLFTFTSSAAATSLNLSRFDLQPGN